MDTFKAIQQTLTGPGGLKCECCNKYHGKEKQKLNRLVRHKLKSEDKKKENHI